jgi:hypothetical protein
MLVFVGRNSAVFARVNSADCPVSPLSAELITRAPVPARKPRSPKAGPLSACKHTE